MEDAVNGCQSNRVFVETNNCKMICLTFPVDLENKVIVPCHLRNVAMASEQTLQP